jgi:hypothetical protein
VVLIKLNLLILLGVISMGFSAEATQDNCGIILGPPVTLNAEENVHYYFTVTLPLAARPIEEFSILRERAKPLVALNLLDYKRDRDSVTLTVTAFGPARHVLEYFVSSTFWKQVQGPFTFGRVVQAGSESAKTPIAVEKITLPTAKILRNARIFYDEDLKISESEFATLPGVTGTTLRELKVYLWKRNLAFLHSETFPPLLSGKALEWELKARIPHDKFPREHTYGVDGYQTFGELVQHTYEYLAGPQVGWSRRYLWKVEEFLAERGLALRRQ